MTSARPCRPSVSAAQKKKKKVLTAQVAAKHSMSHPPATVDQILARMTDDSVIQATQCKRKYKRRGSKTPAMLMVGCCATVAQRPTALRYEQKMSTSFRPEAAAYHVQESDYGAANDEPLPQIMMPPLISCITALSLRNTSTTESSP